MPTPAAGPPPFPQSWERGQGRRRCLRPVTRLRTARVPSPSQRGLHGLPQFSKCNPNPSRWSPPHCFSAAELSVPPRRCQPPRWGPQRHAPHAETPPAAPALQPPRPTWGPHGQASAPAAPGLPSSNHQAADVLRARRHRSCFRTGKPSSSGHMRHHDDTEARTSNSRSRRRMRREVVRHGYWTAHRTPAPSSASKAQLPTTVLDARQTATEPQSSVRPQGTVPISTSSARFSGSLLGRRVSPSAA